MLIRIKLLIAGLCTSLAILATMPAMAAINNTNISKAKINKAFGQLPLSFEANHGQTDALVKFVSRGPGYALFLTATEAVLRLNTDTNQLKKNLTAATTSAVLRMQLIDANSNATVSGLEMLPGKTHYLTGKNAKQWRTDVPTYAKVRYENIYSGIDLIYYGNQGQLEYDFVVTAGANPNDIQLSFDGVDNLKIDEQGNLVLSTKSGDVVQHAPVIYQEIDGKKKEVAGSYLIKSKHEVGFKVATYNTKKPLVIDPVLVYSTYLGGNSYDEIFAMTVSEEGQVIVAGGTYSLDFPAVQPVQDYQAGNIDAFVTKFKLNGNGIVYSTFLGGSSSDRAFGISTKEGYTFITGDTRSSDFPITSNAYQQFPGGGADMFVIALSPKGKNIEYSTYLGGNATDIGLDIVAGKKGMIYISGRSRSTDFPVKNAIQPGLSGRADAIIAKINISKSGNDSVVFATYFGGDGWESAEGIDLDVAENIYIGGITDSDDLLTTPNAYQENYQTYPSDAFVSKFNTNGDSLVYSTYIGSPILPEDNDNTEDPYDIYKEEEVWDIAVDDAGHAYVTGWTDSADDFPYTAGAYRSDNATITDDTNVFITKLNLDGSALVYSAIVGGSSSDNATGIAVDKTGSAYITGWTTSDDFPIKDPSQEPPTSYYRFFAGYITKLNPTGSELDYSTYFTGKPWSIEIDNCQNIYIAGSAGSSLPTTKGAFQSNYGGNGDGFVAKFEDIPNCVITGK